MTEQEITPLADDRSTHYEWDSQRNRIGFEQYEHDGTDEGALPVFYLWVATTETSR